MVGEVLRSTSQLCCWVHSGELSDAEDTCSLNCLDTLYGHGLLKLLNAQHYLEQCPEMELVVLVPHYLRWMVPEGVAEVWTLDLPVRRGVEWNDWVAQKIRQEFDSLEAAG